MHYPARMKLEEKCLCTDLGMGRDETQVLQPEDGHLSLIDAGISEGKQYGIPNNGLLEEG